MSITKERIEYWLDIANYDLETAEAMLQSKRYLYVGFMCHQVVEKSIKAYLWYTNESIFIIFYYFLKKQNWKTC